MSSLLPSNAGIVTDESSGERHIPESTRADGTTRKAIKIRHGYQPSEDVTVYTIQTTKALCKRRKLLGIPGSEPEGEAASADQSSAPSLKNAKCRGAKKKAKATAGLEDTPSVVSDLALSPQKEQVQEGEVDPQVERERKVRALKKKLRQARQLRDKNDGGETLLADEVAKISKIGGLIHELDALGYDADGAEAGF